MSEMKENKIPSLDIPSSFTPEFTKETKRFYRLMSLDNMAKENYCKKLFVSNSQNKTPCYDKLTVVIPFRASKDDKRIENIKTVLNYLKFTGVKNVIISEEDNVSKMGNVVNEFIDEFEDIKLLFTESYVLFNKAIAINNGVKECKTPYVAIMDSDVLIDKKCFDESLYLIDQFYDFIYPFNRMVKQIYEDITDIENFDFDSVDSELEIRLNADGGLLFCRKESLLNIGGYNEGYKGWGGEDNEICFRINLSKYSIIRLNNVLYHLYHEKEKFSKSNLNSLIESYNLSKFNDVNILINQEESLYKNSLIYKKEEPVVTKDNYLISVIIPVYNCEFFYIDRCINSLKNQTLGFENIEVILVDDASIYQSSIDLINSYVEKYSNVKAIFLDVNCGAGIARNAGIKAATADYITFLDHDDYYVSNICEIAYKNISKGNTDIIITNFINTESLKGTDWGYLKLDGNKKFISKYDQFMKVFLIAPSTGSKTYRKDFLIKNNLFYREFEVAQDLVFNEETLFNASGILLIDTPSIVYSFRKSSNVNLSSNSLKFDKDTIIAFLRAYEFALDLFKKYAPDHLHIPLNSLNYWIKQKLLKASLSFNEFADISREVKFLATFYLKTRSVKRPKENRKLFRLIVQDDLTKAYEYYNEIK